MVKIDKVGEEKMSEVLEQDPNIVTGVCKGCDLTFERPRSLWDWYCKACKQIAEDCYTGFWAAMKIKDTDTYGIGEWNTFQDTSVGVKPRRWIKAFTREETTSVINALAQVHNGYVVTDGHIGFPHPMYLR